MNHISPLVRIHPKIDLSFISPKTGRPLDVRRVWIPGCRVMVEAAAGDESYYFDLPVGFGTRCQCAIDRATGRTFNPYVHSQWYARQLEHGFANPADEQIVPAVEVHKKAERIVVLDCIDDLYGHCLLKLLNAQYLLEKHSDLGLCLLIPKQFAALVPEGVAEVWTLDIPLREGVRWYPGVAKWIIQRLERYQEAFASAAFCQLPNRFADIRFFLRELPKPDQLDGHKPVVVFNARPDRLWGVSIKHQNRRLTRLYDQLKWRFENLCFVVTGFGKSVLAAQNDCLDLRTENLDTGQERSWFRWMAHADTVIGVHGSNMLIPSGLAKNTVELMPEFKYPMLCTDLLYPPEMADPREAIQSRAVLYGDDQLLEISPERVAKTVANQLTHCKANLQWFSLAPDQPLRGDLDRLQSDFGWLGKFDKNKGRGMASGAAHWLRKKLISAAARLE